MTKNEFECYRLFLSLKLYFENKYDYPKYGLIKQKPATYELRKDKFYFKKFGDKYNQDELTNYFVANFVHERGTTWIGNLYNARFAIDNYIQQQQRLQNLTYTFESDCQKLVEFQERFNKSFLDLFKDNDSNYVFPPIIRLTYPETAIIFNECVTIKKTLSIDYKPHIVYKPFDYIDQLELSSPCWYSIDGPILKKYSHFIKFDKEKMNSLIHKYFQR